MKADSLDDCGGGVGGECVDMKCRHCGVDISPNAESCPHCGKPKKSWGVGDYGLYGIFLLVVLIFLVTALTCD